MHGHILNLCLHNHVIFYSLYKIAHIYFLLKLIVTL
jgi:hypothetical protein